MNRVWTFGNTVSPGEPGRFSRLWGYWLQEGANTLWQDWDGSMSHNHIMFGTVSEWFYESLAGI
ncbi:hypothetical protein PZB72_27790 [Catalinimonas niigatensis]|nr:hypothetical protein [Catalinimonas niigatensis]WPP53721.1 hypothetical protein PZB72_27790 [Catalinimonas niigatensis]